MKDRVILHVDINGCYASIECAENPKIRALPVAVCGDAEARHGIILAKNEVAKKYGIKTGDVIWEAKKKCRSLLTITADFKKYLRYSAIFKDIFNDYTDQVESFGIDESWLDITGEDGEKAAYKIQEQVRKETGLPVSIGVSWNKIFAKLGSDMKKPNAVTVISKNNYRDTAHKLPAEDLLYVGSATKKKLNTMGIKTIGDIANADVERLKERLDKWGEYIWMFANGYDLTPVMKTGEETVIKSVGNSTTAIRDLETFDDILMVFSVLSESVAMRIREKGFRGQVVSIHVRNKFLETWGKQIKIGRPTNLCGDILSSALFLFKEYNFKTPVRSLGVSISGLRPDNAPIQMDLLGREYKAYKNEKLERALDFIKYKYGCKSIVRGVETLDKALTGFSPKDDNTIHPSGYFRQIV